MIDRLREWLLPALGLMILAALWGLAKARAIDDDLNRSVCESRQHAMLDRMASAADD